MARKGSTPAYVLTRKLRAAGVCNPGDPVAFGRRQGVFVSNGFGGSARVRVDFDSARETAAMLDAIVEAVTAWGYTVNSRSDMGVTVTAPAR